MADTPQPQDEELVERAVGGAAEVDHIARLGLRTDIGGVLSEDFSMTVPSGRCWCGGELIVSEGPGPIGCADDVWHDPMTYPEDEAMKETDHG